MRKLSLDLDAITVESFVATPRALPARGTVDAYAAVAEEQIRWTYGVCYTQDLAFPECVCDITRTCPTFDRYCPVAEAPVDAR